MAFTRLTNKPVEHIWFNGKDAYWDFGMILTDIEINPPRRKVTKVSTVMMQGDIDISDALSAPRYENRTIKMTYSVPGNKGVFRETYRKLCEHVNGVYFDRSLVIDGNRYTGRASINKWRTSASLGVAVIEVDAKPYIYDMNGAKRYE